VTESAGHTTKLKNILNIGTGQMQFSDLRRRESSSLTLQLSLLCDWPLFRSIPNAVPNA
jgi:hypothetical protein